MRQNVNLAIYSQPNISRVTFNQPVTNTRELNQLNKTNKTINQHTEIKTLINGRLNHKTRTKLPDGTRQWWLDERSFPTSVCHCSSKSGVVVAVARHTLKRGGLLTQPQLPPYHQSKASLPNKPQVDKGGAQPQEKRINQISITREIRKKKCQYPQNNDSKTLTVTTTRREENKSRSRQDLKHLYIN